MREIVFDTETTGLEPDQGHRIVEIGCLELQHHVPTGRTLHTYFNPERDMPEDAFKVHGLSAEFLSDKPLFRDRVEEIEDFIGASPLVAHNANFDFKFLNAELKWADRRIVPRDRMVDTLSMARERNPGAPASLDALCKRYNVDASARVKHGALLDAELLAAVYLELRGGREPGLGILGDSSGSGHIAHKRQRQRPVPLKPLLTEEEKAAHAAFIASLPGDTLWKL